MISALISPKLRNRDIFLLVQNGIFIFWIKIKKILIQPKDLQDSWVINVRTLAISRVIVSSSH